MSIIILMEADYQSPMSIIILMEADYQSPWLVEYWPAGHSEQLAKPAIRGKGLRTPRHPRLRLNSHAAVSVSDQLSEAERCVAA